MSRKKILVMNILLYVVCLSIILFGMYHFIVIFTEKTIYVTANELTQKELELSGFDPSRLKLARGYAQKRLLAIRSMIIFKNGKPVQEDYFWKGGPEEKDYLHSLNMNVIHLLIGIAVKKKIITGPQQNVAHFFPEYFKGVSDKMLRNFTIKNLLEIDAPLLWGDKCDDYWKLLHSGDKIKESLKIIKSKESNKETPAKFASQFLLSKIIENASFMDIFNFADLNLFKPLGIVYDEKSGIAKGPLKIFAGFRLKGMDLAKFGQFILNKGVWQDKQILPENWISFKVRADYKIGEKEFISGVWESVEIGRNLIYRAIGEGGQFIILVPEFNVVIAITSKSLFPIQQISGYDELLRLVLDSIKDNKYKRARAKNIAVEDEPFYEPNFIMSTDVPQDIKQFFINFSKDIYDRNLYNISYNYAKGYRQGREDYEGLHDFWRGRFFEGPSDVESVEIKKVRVEKNRAYLRGTIKYSYISMMRGSLGYFPIDNLIKLKGRWRWLGSPKSSSILDRDEYFDAEISPQIAEFLSDCSMSIVGESKMFQRECFSKDFNYNEKDESDFIKMMRSLLKKPDKTKLHLTKIKKSDKYFIVEGYFENSHIGELRLPIGMKIVNVNGNLMWHGNNL